MPHASRQRFKTPAHERAQARERMRRYRARQRADRVRQREAAGYVPTGSERAMLLATWASEKLTIPPGHPASGLPMQLPAFGQEFLSDALADGVREALLSMARKNAKSAICAVLVLGMLGGPLARPGLRIGTVSVTRDKAGELYRQCRDIAEASGLDLDFRLTPSPGMIRGDHGGTAEFLSADKSSGHASGFDLAIVDELGLMTERDRALIAGMRTSTSARNGRLIAISIRGECPMLEEMMLRSDLESCVVHHYAPDSEDAPIDARATWAAANPGLGSIKSEAWMADEARRVAVTPSDLGTFRAFDLNLPQQPAREMIFSPQDLAACYVDRLPPREGPCYVGLDFGGAEAMTAAYAIWPLTGRCEGWGAFGDVPPLAERGLRDGARYDLMAARGELRTYSGRVTPVADFLRDVAEALYGAQVRGSASDAWKAAEARDFFQQAGLRWPHTFRRSGSGREGSHDVRAMQRLVLTQRLRMTESLTLASAVRNSAIRRDANGNPALDKESGRRRIDMLSAAIVAAGLAEPDFNRAARGGVYRGAA